MNQGATEQSELLVAVAEASAWIALLHGPRRTPAAERGLQHWLAERSLHRQAFEHATNTWQRTRGNVRGAARMDISVPGDSTVHHHYSWPTGLRRVLAIAATLVMLVVGGWYVLQPAAVATRLGERRMLVLDDGTQVTLNTDTRVVVRYNEHERRVRLLSGEALFEVARHIDRPFIVDAGDRKIRALGTAFLVRRDTECTAVTLVEGKISIDSTASSPSLLLAAGERATYSSSARSPKLDRPQVEKLTAWQQGLVNIDNLTLAQALEEMNRYSALKLSVEGPAREIRVSGVFRITDAESMAKAVAMTHGLKVSEDKRRLVISGIPLPASESRFDSP